MPIMEFWDDQQKKRVPVSYANPLPTGGGGGAPAPGSVSTDSFAPDAKAPFAGVADSAAHADSATRAQNADSASSADSVEWNKVSGKPATYPPSAHTHTIADIDSLQSTLNDILSRLSALEGSGGEG